PATIGAAGAVASGLMLGSGYLLLSRGLERSTLPVLVGAALGVAYTYWIQSYAGVAEGAGARLSEGRLVLQNGLHSAAEGVAIGVAMVLDLRLGAFLAVALAVHNVAESMALTDGLAERGIGPRQAAGLGVVSDVSMPVMALAAFALSPVLEGLLSGALGFAAGCLVFLILTELLPMSYGRASSLWVGASVSVSAGALVLAEHYLVAGGG
ncbi:MAG: hypothetical protein R3190_09505, partial [Thermoanaerobaculia bacterium]|nr:hypothetical protein [Thermoanaerobaculia bacterium]